MQEINDNQYKSIEKIEENMQEIREELAPIIRDYAGPVEHRFYTNGVEPIVENYLPEGLNLTEQELVSLRNGMRRLSTGLRSSIPIKCYGQKCPFRMQCIDEDALVFGPNGYFKKIKEVLVGDIIFTYNEDLRIVESKKVLRVQNNGKKQTWAISQKNGCSVSVTSNHPVFTITDKVINKRKNTKLENLDRKWMRLEDGLKKGDKLASFAITNSFADISSKDDAILLGYMLTDGFFGESAPSFTNTNKEYVDEVIKIATKKNIEIRLRTRKPWKGKDGVNHRLSYEVIFLGSKDSLFNEWAADMGLRGLLGPDKFIPGEVSLYDRKSFGLFINRLWAGDGSISVKQDHSPQVSISQESFSFINDLHKLLLSKGIKSLITQSKEQFWKLRISGNSISDFFELTGLIFGKKEKSELAIAQNREKNQKHNRREKDIDWNEISEIKETGIKTVYDLSLEDNENFFANGILVHNCPLSKIGKMPMGKPCPIEEILMDGYTKGYIDEFDVQPGSLSEVTTMTMLAATHIMEMRAYLILGRDDDGENPDGFVKNVVGFNSDDEPIIQLQEHPASNQIERAWRWRRNLLESLVGTRKEKYKQMAALGEASTASPSTAAADLKAKIDKMSIIDISEE